MKINKRIHSLLVLVVQVVCLIGVVLIISSCTPIGGQQAPRKPTVVGRKATPGSFEIGGQHAPRNLAIGGTQAPPRNLFIGENGMTGVSVLNHQKYSHVSAVFA